MIKLERTNNAARNIIFGVPLKLYQMLAPFIMRTTLIYTLGVQYLGLNGLFSSILQVLNLAELGVGTAMVYSMYKPIAEDDAVTICALMKLYRLYYYIIGAVIFVSGCALLPFIPKLIKGDTPHGIDVRVLFMLHLAATVLTYWLFAYKNSILNAYQRVDVISKITIVSNTIQYILQFVVLLMLKNYYCYLIIALLMQAIMNITTAIASNKLYPQYKARGKLHSSQTKIINKRIRDLFTAKLGGTLVNSADTIVISAFLGLTVLAIYQNYYFIMTSVIGIVSVVFSSCTAGIGNSLVTETIDKNYFDFRKLTFVICWISAVCVACFATIYQPFMKLWVGEEYIFDLPVVFLFCIYFYVYLVNSIAVSYKEAGGIWHEDRFRPLVGALLNLAINLTFVKRYGIYAILLSTIISYVFVAMPWLIYNVFSVIFKRRAGAYVKELITNLCCAGVVTGVVYFICSKIILEGIKQIIANLIISVSVSNLLLLLIYRKNPLLDSTIDLINNMTKQKFEKFFIKIKKLLK